jgi:Beta-lactamase
MDEREEGAALRPPPGPGPVTPPGFYTFDPAGFMQDLESQLIDNVAGYSIGLNQHGIQIAQSSWNWAKEPQDGAEGWTLDTRMHVASLSKTVTAIAMTKLLGDKGMQPWDLITGFLPEYWVQGSGVQSLTFENLLEHKSGLALGNPNGRTDFQWMKEQIALGSISTDTYDYQNLNYGLCRILLATINGDVPVDGVFPGWEGSVDCLWDAATITAYQAYVTSEVFAPSGVSGPTFTHAAADTLAYDFPVTGNGWNSGDVTYLAGEAGWHMTVNQMLAVMGTFRRAGTIVTPDDAQLMLTRGFGINATTTTNVGTYYVKYGGWTGQSDYEEQCEAFFLPLDMELVVFVNSQVKDQAPPGKPGPTLEQWVASAYQDNIKGWTHH